MLTDLPKRYVGVTLIELAVAIAIFALLAMVGLPGFMEWIHNTQLRTAAEGVRDGLKIARMEAIRQNAKVEFVLSSPSTTGGTGWSVRLASTGTTIKSKPNGEASASAVLSAVPADADTVTFDGLGRTVNNADGSQRLTRINIDSAVLSASQSRELSVMIGSGAGDSGGQIRMCDPQVNDSTDPRKC